MCEVKVIIFSNKIDIYHFRQTQSLHNHSNLFLPLPIIHLDFGYFQQYQAKILCNYSKDYVNSK